MSKHYKLTEAGAVACEYVGCDHTAIYTITGKVGMDSCAEHLAAFAEIMLTDGAPLVVVEPCEALVKEARS